MAHLHVVATSNNASNQDRRHGNESGASPVAHPNTSSGKPGAFLLIASADGTAAGIALVGPGRADEGTGPLIPGLCFVAMFSVVPNRWGQGIGGRLVDAAIAEAAVSGYDRAHLWTHANNLQAQRLYEGRRFS